MKQYTYLLVNFFSVIIPFIASFHPKLMFWKNVKAFLPANIITTVLFLIWDVWFTEKGVWGFNPDYLVGIFIWGLPIEEILFFLCIPYACLFSYHCFGVWKERYLRRYSTKAISVILVLFGAIMLLLYYQKIYPVMNFIMFSLLIAYLAFIKKSSWLGQFYFTYLIMIIPFLIVNGVLTGTGLEAPIVWYNSEEITGIRINTIPFEDVFYGMSLIGMNILLYEGFLTKLKYSRGV
ncbi:lycopene cyclase domain-containing protein [Pedobacter sp. UBA4863]|uniref:lycopene cyclase domain-containing protein n=1 Tax=Pedobacter sp. UBA4863 TaxID=1947060 RepID=UPI0025F78C48|nr:lycopene cyclase domain-containing protein [Pedobacter sp. UBA4863]